MKEITAKEIEYIQEIIDSLDLPYYIYKLDNTVNDVKIYWKDLSRGQAQFKWFTKRIYIREPNIQLRGPKAEELRMDIIRTKVPAICHELRHVRQYDTYGPMWYFLNNLPLIQNLKMEKEAYAVEDAAMEQLELTKDLYL